MPLDNDSEKWELSKHKIGFFAGLAGMFLYCGIVELGGYPFHIEFLLGFLAISGFSLSQGADRSRKNDDSE